jgi:ribonuclease P protein component
MNDFRREERLKSEKTINRLFKEGRSFSCYPLRLVFIEHPPAQDAELDSNPVQVAFSVPKRNFKKSVDRNLLKRRMREAYRLHKNEVYNLLKNNELYANSRFSFMLLYTAKEELTYAEIEKGIVKMIVKFKLELQNNV